MRVWFWLLSCSQIWKKNSKHKVLLYVLPHRQQVTIDVLCEHKEIGGCSIVTFYSWGFRFCLSVSSETQT